MASTPKILKEFIPSHATENLSSSGLPHSPTLLRKQERALIVTNRQAELSPFTVEKSITEKSFVKANYCLAALIYIFIKFD